ncbi:hypothetical protein ZEAMMB73_Zm00001d047311 [Zea mays]|uniref:Uncharacterized protein n=1 Tax=Zea mays TaxID=4577 RepID=A0A1D6P8M1_MAIZE|nr:hypothetical protein ZEAMMB73_Zm00001d047311 [Zea mays]AQL06149.1 hypothetical protein ZEAMMB73_Zm00001d047311 [Zea mays]
MAVNWELQGCCHRDQRIFITGVSTIVILLLRTFLLKPFKLITVFLHETSHTLVCKLTCSDGVSSMVRYAELRLMATFQAASSELECFTDCLVLLPTICLEEVLRGFRSVFSGTSFVTYFGFEQHGHNIAVLFHSYVRVNLFSSKMPRKMILYVHYILHYVLRVTGQTKHLGVQRRQELPL